MITFSANFHFLGELFSFFISFCYFYIAFIRCYFRNVALPTGWTKWKMFLFLLMSINYNNPVRDSLLLSVHTCSSWASSGITRNVLQPWRFLDFRMSPKMWSPMYKMSFPFAPNRSQTMSEEPVEKKHIQSGLLDHNYNKNMKNDIYFYLTTRIHYAMLQWTCICSNLQSPSGLQNRNMATSMSLSH